MARVVEHSHHHDDVEMTEGVASSAPHASRLPAPGATVPVEQPPSAAARAARRQESGRPSRAPSQAASGGATNPSSQHTSLMRGSPLRRKADSGRTKPAPAESRLRSHQARSGGKPTPVALSRLWWLSPAESRLRSHPRLYISVSPTLRGPAGNKTFSFVTR
jgi:hypothetical protein